MDFIPLVLCASFAVDFVSVIIIIMPGFVIPAVPPVEMEILSMTQRSHKPHEGQSLLLVAAHCCPAVPEGDIMLVDEGHCAVDSRQGDVRLCQVHQVRLQMNVHFLRRAMESDVNIFTWTTEKNHQLTEETLSTLFKSQHNVTQSHLDAT